MKYNRFDETMRTTEPATGSRDFTTDPANPGIDAEYTFGCSKANLTVRQQARALIVRSRVNNQYADSYVIRLADRVYANAVEPMFRK